MKAKLRYYVFCILSLYWQKKYSLGVRFRSSIRIRYSVFKNNIVIFCLAIASCTDDAYTHCVICHQAVYDSFLVPKATDNYDSCSVRTSILSTKCFKKKKYFKWNENNILMDVNLSVGSRIRFKTVLDFRFLKGRIRIQFFRVGSRSNFFWGRVRI